MTDKTIGQEFEDDAILAIASGAHADRVDLLNEAITLTAGSRNRDYGDPYDNHVQIADIFHAITGKVILPHEVAIFHVATKLARMRTSPSKKDSYVDAMAYLGIAFECQIKEMINASSTDGNSSDSSNAG